MAHFDLALVRWLRVEEEDALVGSDSQHKRSSRDNATPNQEVVSSLMNSHVSVKAIGSVLNKETKNRRVDGLEEVPHGTLRPPKEFVTIRSSSDLGCPASSATASRNMGSLA